MKRDYIIYILGLCAVVLITFFWNQPGFGYGLFILVGIYLLHQKYDFSYYVPLLILAPFIISRHPQAIYYFFLYAIILAIILILDFVKQYKFHRFGSLGLGLFLFLDAAALSLFNAESVILGLQGLILILIVFLLYLYFVNTIQANQAFIIKIAFVFMMAAWVLFIQNIYLSLMSPLAFFDADVTLMWAKPYEYPFIYVMSVPLTALYMLKSRNVIFGVITWLMALLGLLLSAHMPSIFSVTVMFVVILIYFFKHEKAFYKPIMIGLAIFILTMVSLDFLMPNTPIRQHLLSHLAFHDALLRFEATLRHSRDIIFNHPILGHGGVYHIRTFIEEGALPSLDFQNILLLTMSMGTIGLIVFIYLLYKKIVLIMHSETQLRFAILLLLLVTIFIQGIFIAVYYHPIFLISIFLWMAIIESDAKNRIV